MNNLIGTEEWICNCLSDLGSFNLTMAGIQISVFTLLYSLIIAKRDELKLIAEYLKLGSHDPFLQQKQKYAAKYIERLKELNSKCIVCFICFISIYALDILFMRLLKQECLKCILIVVFITTLLVSTYFFYFLYCFLSQYRKETEI